MRSNFAFLLIAWALSTASTSSLADRPNVLFIAVDDLRAELGCYGAKHIHSPNIDALAAGGVRFDRAYCQQAICGPSRASVLTGLRPDSARVHGNHAHFRDHYPGITTLPQHFKNHGYHTRAMGKIYHGVFPKGSSRTVADTFGDNASWSIPAFRPGPRYYYTEAGIAAAKEVYQRIYKPTNPGPSDWTTKLVFGPATEAPEVDDAILYDGQVADRAVASLAELSKEDQTEPFFLAVGFIKPHSPYIAPKKYWDLYDPEAIKIAGQTEFPKAPSVALHNSGELRRYTDQPKTGPITDSNQRRIKHAYYACISYIDAQIGRVLDALDEHDLQDDTIVVLWSDHGYHLGEQNLWGKTTNFELDTRVPLIVRAPGRGDSGKNTTALVELVDLYPTLAELCQLPVSKMLEGTSFVPLLDQPKQDWKSAAFSQFTRGKTRGYSIRTKSHRYTEWQEVSTGEVKARELYEYDSGSYPVESDSLSVSNSGFADALSLKLASGHGWKQVRRQLDKPTTELQFARVFTDHMVLPRDRKFPVWGKAASQSLITIEFKEHQIRTTADEHGNWIAFLPPTPASAKPTELKVNDIVLHDILVGDVWFCSGQSNMRWMLKQSTGAADEIATASAQEHLRLLDLTANLYPVGRVYDLEVLRSTDTDNYYDWSGWQSASSESAATFSAVAWHFGKRLLELDPNVPIGLVHNAIGGTPMESWIPETELLGDSQLRSLVTVQWHDESHPTFPKWCGQRGRRNLGAYFANPDGPAPSHPFQPGFLFDAGVKPFTSFPVSGVIWYQGESNATEDGAGSPAIDPRWNKHLFEKLIGSWRKAWSDPELAFVFAQLPGLNREWTLFRELQNEVADDDPNTLMAVTIDVGHPTNVHPPNKQPVGQRMADLASGVASSPAVTELSPTKVTFDRAIVSSDGEQLRGFQLAGSDRRFYPAVASIEGNTVVISSETVPAPIAVRFGWENNPNLNLVAAQGGHPVSPFRSDRWNEETEKPEPIPGTTGFESVKAGPLLDATFDGVDWAGRVGHAEILPKLAKSGKQCLHLLGGERSQVELSLSTELAQKKYQLLTFAAERWTRRSPFRFRVEAWLSEERWQEIYNGDQTVMVGRGYLNQVLIPIPENAKRFRMSCESPPDTGILIDDLSFVEAKPMNVTVVQDNDEVAPVLIGQSQSPLLTLSLETTGNLSPQRVSSVEIELIAGVDLLSEIKFEKQQFRPAKKITLDLDYPLKPGINLLPINCELRSTATLDQFVAARLLSISLSGGKVIEPDDTPIVRRRVGVALRQRGQDGVHTYRIPGITTTNRGTLIAVYDNRNRAGGDLPGDIDVGMSRSMDGGQTWQPMRVIMDMGDDPSWRYDGVGDPSILTDRETGTIWVAATWSHGNRSWFGSGPGLKPEETGQLMLAKSTDDGVTWSEPINITEQVKVNPDWRFVLQGPGNGITLADGTVVFPAQFRGVNDEPVRGKPFSTIIYSRDRGQTWSIGSGVKIDTTEAQIVQLGDGTIMINCRDNRGGSRSVYTTNDLGKTWTQHPTSRKALREPVCNADLMRVVHPDHGALLFFSNPNTTRGRSHFTLKVSDDEGMTWPEKWHTLYDARAGSGYSTLTQIDGEHIGVLYEGRSELYFLRYSIDELVANQ